MRKSVAQAILEASNKLDPGLNALTELTYQIEDHAERKLIRQHLANAMHLLGYELVMHIVRQYPDLDPDKLDSDK